MSFLVAIYEHRAGFSQVGWTTLGIGAATVDDKGTSLPLMKERVLHKLKAWVKKAKARDLAILEKLPGMTLEHHNVTLTTPHVSTNLRHVPLVIEPRRGGARNLRIGYHPLVQRDFFVIDEERPIGPQYRSFLEALMHDVESSGDVTDLQTRKDRLRTLVFDAEVPSLLERVGPARGAWWSDLRSDAQKREDEDGPASELDAIATDLSERATENGLAIGLPREPHATRLKTLADRGPVVVIGPPGVGKTTFIHHWVHARLHDDGYAQHKSLDRVRRIWALSGRRILAGMKHHGDWEARVAKLIDELARRRGYLYVPDLPAWALLGKSRDSERCLADVMRGPLERREVTLIGEATREAWTRLEAAAPAFTSQFQTLTLPEPHPDEVLCMVLAHARKLEDGASSFETDVFDTLAEWAELLSPGRAEPGRSLAMLADARSVDECVSRWELIEALSTRAGLDNEMLVHETREVNHVPAAISALTHVVVGQPEATTAMADLMQRIRIGLTDPARPWGVFLFTGPTGTGKTELSKALARLLFNDDERLVRIDMNQLTGPDAVGRLIGDAHDPNGRLTGPILDAPFQVVLLDELEKAHPSALYLLLQLLDEGRLTDYSGRTADFRRSVILITSNLGASARPSLGFGDAPTAAARRSETTRAVAAALPPELFNRLDGVVAFQPLSAEAAHAIAKQQVARLSSRPGIRDRQASLECTPAAIDLVVQAGFDPEYGARTVKRWIESHITDPLAAHLVRVPGDAFKRIRVDAHDGQIAIEVEALAPATTSGDAPFAYLLEGSPSDCDASIDQLCEQLAALIERPDRDTIDERKVVAPVSSDEADQLYWRDQLHTEITNNLQQLRRIRNIRRSPVRDIVEALSRGTFLVKIAPHVDDEIHRITLHLSRPMSSGARLLPALVKAYTRAPNEVEAVARCTFAGNVVTNLEGTEMSAVVLQLAGLGIREAMASELGTHVLDVLAGGLEVVSVREVQGEPKALITLPCVLAPQVRTLRHEAGKEARPYVAHDYRSGHHEAGHITELADLVTWFMTLASAAAPGRVVQA